MEPKVAKPGSFWYKRHERFTRGRLRKEIITLEEALWLVVGLAFGFFAGKGAPILILLIPAVMFAVWVYEYIYAKKYGVRTIHGKLIKK